MGMNPHRTPLPNPPLPSTAVQLRSEYGADISGPRRALAANSFRLLQDQGFVPREARLDSAAPRGGGTYRDRFESLIQDRNRDGHLDLDLEQLRGSGLVRGDATVQQLDRALAHDVRQSPLTDEFLREQRPDHRITGQDRLDQRASRDLQLRNPNDWGVRQYGSAAEVRAAATDGTQATGIARDAVLAAQVMEGRGDLAGARQLLARTGQGLQEAHQFGAARTTLRELTRSPLADGDVNLVQAQHDAIVRAHPDYDPRSQVISITSDSGNRTDIREGSLQSTYGRMAQGRLAQIDQVERMETQLGRRVDPTNLDDAQAYLQGFARTHTQEQARAEYSSYVQNFFQHAGQGVTWDPTVPVAERPGRMTEYLREQPVDAQGRRLIDCEGFIYMNDRLLPQMGFDVVHGGNGSHVISIAQDPRTGQGFTIDNNRVSDLMPRRELARDAETRLPGARFHRSLARVDEQGSIPLD